MTKIMDFSDVNSTFYWIYAFLFLFFFLPLEFFDVEHMMEIFFDNLLAKLPGTKYGNEGP